MVDTFGQESIGNLMPLIIHVLESLNSALIDNEDIMIAIEKLTQANRELMKQEKQCRKEIEEVSTNIHKMCSVCGCLLYTSPSPRDATLSRMPSSA